MFESLSTIRSALGWGAMVLYLTSKALSGDAKLFVGGFAVLLFAAWLIIAVIQLPGGLIRGFSAILAYFSPESRAERAAQAAWGEILQRVQHAADEEAQEFAEASGTRPMSLLLRPFRTDGNVLPVCDWLKDDESHDPVPVNRTNQLQSDRHD